MKGKIIFILAIAAFCYIYYLGSTFQNNDSESSRTTDSGLKFENNLSMADYNKKERGLNKNQKPLIRQTQSLKNQQQRTTPRYQNNQAKNTYTYNQNRNYKSQSSISPEEIKRREQAIFDNLKQQQRQAKYRRSSQNYTNRYANNQNNYIHGNIPIDKPPTYEQMQKGAQKQREYYIDENLKKGDRVIPVNPLSSFSYKSKQEVFDERKKYVSTSLFAYPGYEPSEKVFGQIEDGKPWISISFEEKNGMSDVEGLSEESRFINNPSVLVAADYNGVIQSGDEIGRYNYRNTMPSSIKYIQSENLIEVVYPTMHLKGSYRLDGMNARDFGYKYARLDNNKSKNVYMQDFNSIATDIVEFRDFIHTGGSCRVPGGCNNGSPHQPMLVFKYPDQSWEVVLYIKLWREKPSSYDEPADINERIIILPKYST